jgi:acetoin utilization deacetylase AcuC-like enzyme
MLNARTVTAALREMAAALNAPLVSVRALRVRVVSHRGTARQVLEGGYNLLALRANVAAHVAALARVPFGL